MSQNKPEIQKTYFCIPAIIKTDCFPLCIQENVARILPNVLCGHSEKDRRRISPIISAFDRMKNDSRYVISISKRKAQGEWNKYLGQFLFPKKYNFAT